MITTVTLNASIDKAYVMEQAIENGTVMRVKEVRNTAGGKGLNVAKVARICGADVQATGFAGGYNGQYLEDLARRSDVKTRFFHVEGETRSCINILDPKYGSTEYLEPGFQVKEEDTERFLAEFPSMIAGSSVVTMSGSAPGGVSADIYRKLTMAVKKTASADAPDFAGPGGKVILDTSGNYLREGILGRPDMIKPNEDEIEALLGIHVSGYQDVISSARQLHEKYQIPWVVVSLGAEGAVLACEKGIFHGKPPALTPVNTVGCGDSMTGAFAVAMERNLGPEQALAYAVAVSAASATSPLTGDFDPSVYEKIREDVTVTEV